MTSERPVYYNGVNTPGSDVAAETASALAIGYLVFKDRDTTYANQLLNTAKNIYDFAYNYRGLYSNYIPDAARTYGSGGYEDELTQAGVWLYRATGIHSYLTQAESFTRNDWAWSYSWDLKEVAANILLYDVTTESNKKATYGNHVPNFLRRWSPTGNVPFTPGGLVYRDQWGSLRYAANTAFAALLAQDVGIISQGDIDSRTALDPAAQLHYILGNNPAGLSYVVGFGRNYPKRPHHKSSFCAPAPAPQCTFTQFNSLAPHYYLLSAPTAPTSTTKAASTTSAPRSPATTTRAYSRRWQVLSTEKSSGHRRCNLEMTEHSPSLLYRFFIHKMFLSN
ncbi:endoglucanase A-like [Dreissena polymorpha]|uniref:Endoglucanase n=1 Tax=Dreissena polymorpha TaxID=45954 RepID=A0A9D4BSG0_DREPO|nr:endoglucanase A-like [Dreissena polymorpha]KAH3706397.1 hypothetical protein DPMN_065783 [Dreissena polymorpha]